MRRFVVFLLLAALIWGVLPVIQPFFDIDGGAAHASSGSSDDDDDDDDNSGSGSGSSGSGSGSGSGSSGSGSSGSGSSGSGSSGSGSSGSGSSGSGSSSSGSGSSSSGSGSAGTAPGGSGSGGVTLFGGDGIHVQFSDGHTERIRGTRFEKLDSRGHVIERRAARRSDVDRLRSLGSVAGRQGVQNVAQVNEASGAIDITDFRGWREIVSRGSYLLKDPRGRTVARRAVTVEDIRRIREMLNLD